MQAQRSFGASGLRICDANGNNCRQTSEIQTGTNTTGQPATYTA